MDYEKKTAQVLGQRMAYVEVAGTHLIQEDSPDEIGRGLSTWLKSL